MTNSTYSLDDDGLGRSLLDTSAEEEDETVALCSSLARVATECVREDNDPVVRTEEALTIISITILCIFELELLLQVSSAFAADDTWCSLRINFTLTIPNVCPLVGVVL